MANFNLDDYETVEVRLAKFWDKYPAGRVETHLVSFQDNQFIFVAHLFRTSDLNELAFSNGYAHEVIGVGMVNKTSALENCETSAIGRALANADFATKGKRPSREEMAKVKRAESDSANSPTPKVGKPAKAPQKASEGVAEGFASAGLAGSRDELREVWESFSHVLDEEVDGIKLRAYITARVEELG
jgi:hypothetical protein